MRAAYVRHPIAHGFIDGFLQRFLSRVNGHDFRAEHFHAIHVEHLAFAIHRAHIDDAFHPEHRADGGGGHAVLPRAGLGDDAGLAHALGQQDLTHGVVDLVRAGVVEVFALQINFRAAEFLGEAFGEIQRRGATDKFSEVVGQFLLKLRVMLCAEIFFFQLLQRVHQRLGHVTSAERPKMAGGVGKIQIGNCAHALILTQRRKDAKKFSARPSCADRRL